MVETIFSKAGTQLSSWLCCKAAASSPGDNLCLTTLPRALFFWSASFFLVHLFLKTQASALGLMT